MKRKYFFILSPLLCLFLTACSAILSTWYYTSESEDWKRVEPFYGVGVAYRYETIPDTITLVMREPDTFPVIIGPIFFPVVFPTCLGFWAKEEPKSTVDATFNTCQPFTLYPQTIRFIDNKGQAMTPTMIECLNAQDERIASKLDSTAIEQGINISKTIKIRWHFKDKQAKVKGFSVLMNVPLTNEKDGKPLSIKFRRRTYYQYVPLLVH